MSCFQCSRSLSEREEQTIGGLRICDKCCEEQRNHLRLRNRSNDSKRNSTRRSPTPISRKSTIEMVRPSAPIKTSSNGTLERFEPATMIRRDHKSSPLPSAPSLTLKGASPTKIKSSHNSLRECQVCLDEKSADEFRPIPNHQCRQNPPTICNSCVYRHIENVFAEVLIESPMCPELSCKKPLTYDAIRHILISNGNKELFGRYDTFLARNALEKTDEFIWCSNVKCQRGQLNPGKEQTNIVTCSRCKHKTCFVHKTPWHEGLTCKEYDATVKGDQRATLQWLNKNTKTCPKCSYHIEKNDGCDHMTCWSCKYEFCWSCLADYDQIRNDGNHRHREDCKHYAAYVKVRRE